MTLFFNKRKSGKTPDSAFSGHRKQLTPAGGVTAQRTGFQNFAMTTELRIVCCALTPHNRRLNETKGHIFIAWLSGMLAC